MKLLFALSVLCAVCHMAYSYKPVVLMHGILASQHGMYLLKGFIEKYHPGTYVLPIDMDDYISSLYNPMWKQVETLKAIIMSDPHLQNTTFHFIGHSQGGMLGRALIESWEDHNIDTFITLSSPLMGQYGDSVFLKYLFPGVLVPRLYEIFYTGYGQDRFSIANYWKDPQQIPEYLSNSVFLPILNNETAHANSTIYKTNFLKLKQLVHLGGPDDGVITPWQSALWSYFDDKLQVVDMLDQQVYQEDSFGLKTLNEEGRIVRYTVPGVPHRHWEKNETVFTNYISQYLT